MTVRVEREKTQESKKKAALRLAQKVRIPGFRPGKAPYHVVERMLGDTAIVEEAADEIGNDVYKAALEQVFLEPAARGEFVKADEEDGQLRLVFKVPKQTEVDLKDYRAIRAELEIETVTDDMVDEALQGLRNERALVEDVERASKVGDEVELDLKVTWWHESEEHEAAEDDADYDDEEDEDNYDDEDDEDDHDGHEHIVFDDREARIILQPDGDKKDLLPGFSAQIVGLSAGDAKEFSLTIPEDFEDEHLRGQEVKVKCMVKAVRSRTLPELNDTFAQAVSIETPTLLDLRIKVRKDLEEAARLIAERNLFNKVVDEIVEQADVKYHDVMVQAYTDELLLSMDRALRDQMGLGLRDYMQIAQKSLTDLRAEYRASAIQKLRRDAVLMHLLKAEGIEVAEAEIENEIEESSKPFGDQASIYRKMLDTPENRSQISDRLLNRHLIKRVVEIATGNAPPLKTTETPSQ